MHVVKYFYLKINDVKVPPGNALGKDCNFKNCIGVGGGEGGGGA
jgi:hypothetical protein